MKKLLLLSLILATSAVNLSAASTTNVTAKINVIDPASDVSINVDSSSATFGDIMIATGKYNLKNKVTLTIEGTSTKNAEVTIPKTLKLSTGASGSDSKIVANISIEKKDDSGFSETTTANDFLLSSTAGMNTKSPLSAQINASLDLMGTETAGKYSGILILTANYK